MGIVTSGDSIRTKLANKGLACLYLGHADQHSGDVHRFLKLSTKRVIRSRDVCWLNKTFGTYMDKSDFDSDEDSVSTSSDDDDDDDDDGDDDGKDPTTNDDAPASTAEDPTPVTFPTGRVTRSGAYVTGQSAVPTTDSTQVRALGGTWFNPTADRIVDDAQGQDAAIDAATPPSDAPSGRDKELSSTMIEHLFGDVAFLSATIYWDKLRPCSILVIVITIL